MNERSFVGRRVIHDGTCKEGIIANHPSSTATTVYVLFDGADEPIPCHPGTIDFIQTENEYA